MDVLGHLPGEINFEHCLLLLERDGCRHTVVSYPTVRHLLFYSLPSSAWKKHGGGVDLIKQLFGRLINQG